MENLTTNKDVVSKEENKKQIENLEFIKTAFENAKTLVMGTDENGNPKTYYDMLLAQRIEGPTNAGSSYKVNSPKELYQTLVAQKWEETTHPDVMPGCRVFKCSGLEGLEGILNLDQLPDDVEMFAIDPKNTGKVNLGVGNIAKVPT